MESSAVSSVWGRLQITTHSNGTRVDAANIEVHRHLHTHLNEISGKWAQMDPVGLASSEIHFDRIGGRDAAHLMDGDDPNVLEIWYNVFIQFNRDNDGSLKPLPSKHIDTGMGFERLVSVLQNKLSNYDTDLFSPIFTPIQGTYSGRFGNDDVDGIDTAYRVVADHVRTLLKKLGAPIGSFFSSLMPVVVETMGDVFPELTKKQGDIKEILDEEEESFSRTLDRGEKLFDQYATRTKDLGAKELNGAYIWRLYDTYGFPVDLARLMAEELGLGINEKEFEDAQEHSKLANGASKFQLGNITATVKGIYYHKEFISSSSGIPADANFGVLLDRTSFYAEAGGQEYDAGNIVIDGVTDFEVTNAQAYNGYVLHTGSLKYGQLSIGDEVISSYDELRRYTTTHILNFCLREVLSDHIDQRGSLVAPTKLCFDFSHKAQISLPELAKIESMSIDWIKKNVKVYGKDLDLMTAHKISGLRAVFGEAYPDPVRVVVLTYDVDEVAKDINNPKWRSTSVEICGGTHVAKTGDIKDFVITEESGIAKTPPTHLQIPTRCIQEHAEVEATLTELDIDAEINATQDAVFQWSSSWPSYTSFSTSTPYSDTGTYTSASYSADNATTTGTYFTRDPRVLSTISERTEHPSRPTSFTQNRLSAHRLSTISNPHARLTIESPANANRLSTHSQGHTRGATDLPTTSRRTGDLIAFFEDRAGTPSKEKERIGSPFLPTTQSTPHLGSTTGYTSTGYGYTTGFTSTGHGYTTTGYTTSRPSSSSKSRSDDSRSTVSTSSGGGGTDLSLSTRVSGGHSNDTPRHSSPAPMDSAGAPTSRATSNFDSSQQRPNAANDDEARPPQLNARTGSPPPITASSVQTNGDTVVSSPTSVPIHTGNGISTLSPVQHRFCLSTVHSLKKLEDASAFVHPVDAVALNIPHYPAIIKTPMDLGASSWHLIPPSQRPMPTFHAISVPRSSSLMCGWCSAKILIQQLDNQHDRIQQSTALRWLAEFLTFVPDVMVPFTPRLIPAILLNLAHHVPMIQSAALRTNKLLLNVIQNLLVPVEGLSRQNTAEKPIAPASSPTPVPQPSRQITVQPPSRDVSSPESLGDNQPSSSSEKTTMTQRPRSGTMQTTVTESSSRPQSRMSSNSVVGAPPPPPPPAPAPTPPSPVQEEADQFNYQATVNELTIQFLSEHEQTRVAALKWLIMLHQKAPKKILAMDDGTFPALLKTLSDSSEEVIKHDLQLLAQISSSSEESYFKVFMMNLLELFSTDRKLLEARGSLIIRQLCLNLNTERIYKTFAEILEKEEVARFSWSLMQC
ncbi:hypothetical protein BDR05DRAFT_1006020 [Suillus weaverae]|nr:hypothetical protein BDR05DRAFT_1006020 [Suillus weaverae]